MKIINEKPPIYEEVKKHFDIEGKKLFFAYGDTIYNPEACEVREDILIHELTHSRQQGRGPQEWWWKYINDPKFRLEQEIEAYQEQYKFLKTRIKDRNQLFRYAASFARDLSSEVYGNLVGSQEALGIIRNV